MKTTKIKVKADKNGGLWLRCRGVSPVFYQGYTEKDAIEHFKQANAGKLRA